MIPPLNLSRFENHAYHIIRIMSCQYKSLPGNKPSAEYRRIQDYPCLMEPAAVAEAGSLINASVLSADADCADDSENAKGTS